MEVKSNNEVCELGGIALARSAALMNAAMHENDDVHVIRYASPFPRKMRKSHKLFP